MAIFQFVNMISSHSKTNNNRKYNYYNLKSFKEEQDIKYRV